MHDMNLNQINNKLFELYSSKLNNLKAMYNCFDVQQLYDYTNPLLLCCHAGFLNAKKRVIFIGQETNKWLHDELKTNKVQSIDMIRELQSLYNDFLLSQRCNTVFWQFINSVNEKICKEKVGYMWSNVWKIGKKSGKGRANSRINDLENSYFNIGREELQILKPDIIVFLSGPHYDDDIEKHFGKIVQQQSFGKCFDKLSISNINSIVFRLYHPTYLRFRRLEKEYREKLCSLIQC